MKPRDPFSCTTLMPNRAPLSAMLDLTNRPDIDLRGGVFSRNFLRFPGNGYKCWRPLCRDPRWRKDQRRSTFKFLSDFNDLPTASCIAKPSIVASTSGCSAYGRGNLSRHRRRAAPRLLHTAILLCRSVRLHWRRMLWPAVPEKVLGT